MSLYLNKGNESLVKSLSNEIYVDKSLIIKKMNAVLGSDDSFMCVTRPRRFGKSMALSLLNAYYSKGCDSRELFKNLKISKDPSFEKHLNKHNVIWIDMAELYTMLDDKSTFVKKLRKFIYLDLAKRFPELNLDYDPSEDTSLGFALSEIAEELGERFIFLIDEWDVVYREAGDNKKLCDACTDFYRSLFKGKSAGNYIDLVYMTGILPIRRYNSQSALNNFAEYNMIRPDGIKEFFGFTESEVKGLCDMHGMDFSEVKAWYDGYRLDGTEIYNPKSVVEAIRRKKCGDYWTPTASIEPVKEYMNYDGGALKGKILDMVAGGKATINVDKFQNDLTEVNSEDAALTVLIHLGYLGYDEESGECFIPNYEIGKEIVNAIEDIPWKDVSDPISGSRRLLEETLRGNTDYIDETFDKNHASLATVMNKNREDVLSVITNISYYHAKDSYTILWEPNCPTGRADAVFAPKKPGYIPIVIELKADKTPDEAIEQIKGRDYASVLNGYHGKVMLLGIAYDSKSLKHHSKIEYVNM